MFKRNISFLTAALVFFSLNIQAADVQVTEFVDTPQVQQSMDPKNTLYIELKDGVVIAELFPNKAPMHVQRIRTLTADGFYDGLKFHRVIDGFMAQTGDPTGTGRGGSRLGRLYSEFNDEHHTRGTLSMARASDPNSANSQFFIVTGEFFPELDGQYTIFGRVKEGMEFVDKIKAGDTSNNGTVTNPDIIIKAVTGDMLNNKSLAVVKEEMALINTVQAENLKQNPTAEKKSILGLLLEAKDIDIGETEPQTTVETTVTTSQDGSTTTTTVTTTNGDISTTATQSGTAPNTQGQKTQTQIREDTQKEINNSIQQSNNELGIETNMSPSQQINK